MSLTSQMTIGRASVGSLLTAAVLVIASLASISMMQTNHAIASVTLFKEKLRGSSVFAQKTINEGSTSTTVLAHAFTTISGGTELCVNLRTIIDGENEINDFEACGPAQLTVANGLSSATFSGTVTGSDQNTGEEKTVTVNADLTGTGKVQTSTFGYHINSRDVTTVFHSNGQNRPASGSLNIGGDFTFSTDDATGIIATVKSGTISVTKN